MKVQVITVEEANTLVWKAFIPGISKENVNANSHGTVPSADSKVAVAVSVSDGGSDIPEEQSEIARIWQVFATRGLYTG